MYIVLTATWYDWEGYTFPEILGTFKTKAAALKKFPDAVVPDDITLYDEKVDVFLIGPVKNGG